MFLIECRRCPIPALYKSTNFLSAAKMHHCKPDADDNSDKSEHEPEWPKRFKRIDQKRETLGKDVSQKRLNGSCGNPSVQENGSCC